MMGGAELPEWFHRGYISLAEIPRAVFTMSARDGLDYAEIAGRLGLSVADVERHLAAALVHLDRAERSGG